MSEEAKELFLTAMERAAKRGPLLTQLGGSELLLTALLALREHLTSNCADAQDDVRAGD